MKKDKLPQNNNSTKKSDQPKKTSLANNNFLKNLSFPKKIGIIYSDVKREYFPTQVHYITEKEAHHDAKLVASYLERMGIKVSLYPGNAYLIKRLWHDKPNIVLNLVDSFKGSEYLSAIIPAVLELLEIPYTGSGILGKSLDCNKFLTKKLLQQNGVPVPYYQLFSTPLDPLDPGLRFPLISKLNEVHGAVEITKEAISENEKRLRERLKFLIKTYKQPVLVEEFIVGREITAFLFEGLNKKVYLAEKVFNKPGEKYVFATFEDQWLEVESFFYEKYNDPLLKEYIRKAFDITRMGDYGKFDIRLDGSSRYFFIDVNHNPAFGPREVDCAMTNIMNLYGIPFLEILKRLLLNTMHDAAGVERLPFFNGG